jgi:hypothetical protein
MFAVSIRPSKQLAFAPSDRFVFVNSLRVLLKHVARDAADTEFPGIVSFQPISGVPDFCHLQSFSGAPERNQLLVVAAATRFNLATPLIGPDSVPMGLLLPPAPPGPLTEAAVAFLRLSLASQRATTALAGIRSRADAARSEARTLAASNPAAAKLRLRVALDAGKAACGYEDMLASLTRSKDTLIRSVRTQEVLSALSASNVLLSQTLPALATQAADTLTVAANMNEAADAVDAEFSAAAATGTVSDRLALETEFDALVADLRAVTVTSQVPTAAAGPKEVFPPSDLASDDAEIESCGIEMEAA